MVDFENCCIHLRDSKTGPRDIHLSDPAIELLKAMPRPDGCKFVFFDQYEGKRLNCIRRFWCGVREVAGIPEFRLHDLRHTFASVAVKSGMSLYKVGKLLGHTQPQTTALYAHLDASAIREDVQQMGELLSPR